MLGGNCLAACEMAAWTSCAAPSRLRSRLNCSTMEVAPTRLDDTMESSPAMLENCFSSGKATAAAIVSGLAPGRLAPTLIVG